METIPPQTDPLLPQMSSDQLLPPVAAESGSVPIEIGPAGSPSLSTIAAIAVLINVTVGTGCFFCIPFLHSLNVRSLAGVFGLPYGFFRAGWLLALISFALSSVFSFFCLSWIVEVVSRAHALITSSDNLFPDYSFNSELTFSYTTLAEIFGGKWMSRFAGLSVCLFRLVASEWKCEC